MEVVVIIGLFISMCMFYQLVNDKYDFESNK